MSRSRSAIWCAYRREGALSEAWLAAAEDAEEYWRDHHPIERDDDNASPGRRPGQLSLE